MVVEERNFVHCFHCRERIGAGGGGKGSSSSESPFLLAGTAAGFFSSSAFVFVFCISVSGYVDYFVVSCSITVQF